MNSLPDVSRHQNGFLPYCSCLPLVTFKLETLDLEGEPSNTLALWFILDLRLIRSIYKSFRFPNDYSTNFDAVGLASAFCYTNESPYTLRAQLLRIGAAPSKFRPEFINTVTNPTPFYRFQSLPVWIANPASSQFCVYNGLHDSFIFA